METVIFENVEFNFDTGSYEYGDLFLQMTYFCSSFNLFMIGKNKVSVIEHTVTNNRAIHKFHFYFVEQ